MELDMSKFMNLPVIDCHAHVRLRKELTLSVLKEEGETLLKVIRLGRLSQMYISSGNIGLYLKAKYPNLFYAGGSIPHPKEATKIDWDRYISDLIEAGFDGIGELVFKPVPRREHIPVDGEFYDGFWSVCESLGYTVLCHIADPWKFWDERLIPEWAKEMGWGYYRGDYPSRHELYREMENVLDRYPKLKVVLCHFYFISDDLDRAESLLEQYKGMHLDLALGIEPLHDISQRRDEWREFFIKYQDRILFGTDIGMSENLQEHLARIWIVRSFLESDEEFYIPSTADRSLIRYKGEPFMGLNLPKQALKKIYADNFRRLWGETPRKVNLEIAILRSEAENETILAKALRELMSN